MTRNEGCHRLLGSPRYPWRSETGQKNTIVQHHGPENPASPFGNALHGCARFRNSNRQERRFCRPYPRHYSNGRFNSSTDRGGPCGPASPRRHWRQANTLRRHDGDTARKRRFAHKLPPRFGQFAAESGDPAFRYPEPLRHLAGAITEGQRFGDAAIATGQAAEPVGKRAYRAGLERVTMKLND